MGCVLICPLQLLLWWMRLRLLFAGISLCYNWHDCNVGHFDTSPWIIHVGWLLTSFQLRVKRSLFIKFKLHLHNLSSLNMWWSRLLLKSTKIKNFNLWWYWLIFKGCCRTGWHGVIFVDKGLFNSFLCHYVREGYIVDTEFKVFSIFCQGYHVLANWKRIVEGAIEDLPFIDLNTVFVNSPATT